MRVYIKNMGKLAFEARTTINQPTRWSRQTNEVYPQCKNHTTDVTSVTGKVFARVLLPRLQQLADRIYPESQCGFRSGRSTTDIIFSVRQIHEKCREQRRPLHIAFVDLTKAFDMVSREGLFAILQKLGCPPTLLSLVKSLHDDMKASVSFKGAMSKSFPVNSGVKQGCYTRFTQCQWPTTPAQQI